MSWSHSKLSKYERCPSVKKFQYDLKIKVTAEKSPQAQRGTDMHTDLEQCLGRNIFETPEWMRPHLPHLDKLITGDTEVKICLDENWQEVAEENRNLICIIDVMQLNADGLRALIVDYKSGKRYDSHIDQLELYCLATLARWPALEVVEGVAYYLDEKPGSWGKPIFLARSNFDAVRKRWETRVAMMNADTEGAPRPGYYCRWCDYRKSEGGPCAFG